MKITIEKGKMPLLTTHIPSNEAGKSLVCCHGLPLFVSYYVFYLVLSFLIFILHFHTLRKNGGRDRSQNTTASVEKPDLPNQQCIVEWFWSQP